MRAVALACGLLVLALAAQAECISISWTPRRFLSYATDVVRGVAADEFTVRVEEVLAGQRVGAGDTIVIPPRGCCGGVRSGADYYLSSRCGKAASCDWSLEEVSRLPGVEAYLRERHEVTRAEVAAKVRAWRSHAVGSDELRRWIDTAYARDDDTDEFRGESLAMAALEALEMLVLHERRAESCSAADAVWVRTTGSQILLDRIATLPPQQRTSEYMQWLDANEEAEDLWDPGQFEDDVAAALSSHDAWQRAEACPEIPLASTPVP
jgi:hypothetical protein